MGRACQLEMRSLPCSYCSVEERTPRSRHGSRSGAPHALFRPELSVIDLVLGGRATIHHRAGLTWGVEPDRSTAQSFGHHDHGGKHQDSDEQEDDCSWT